GFGRIASASRVSLAELPFLVVAPALDAASVCKQPARELSSSNEARERHGRRNDCRRARGLVVSDGHRVPEAKRARAIGAPALSGAIAEPGTGKSVAHADGDGGDA